MTFDKRFLNPLWFSLCDRLSTFARGSAQAKRFDPAVLPFVAVADDSAESSHHLDQITTIGDDVFVVGVIPALSAAWQLRYEGEVAQMIFDHVAPKPSQRYRSQALAHAEVHDMLALTGAAYPGFFRARTQEVGEFYGIYQDGQLVSMLGTRMQFGPFCEITTICTHPDHTGKGYSSQLVAEMISRIQSQGRTAFLHVDCSNTHAMSVYQHAGFREFNRVHMVHVERSR